MSAFASAAPPCHAVTARLDAHDRGHSPTFGQGSSLRARHKEEPSIRQSVTRTDYAGQNQKPKLTCGRGTPSCRGNSCSGYRGTRPASGGCTLLVGSLACPGLAVFEVHAFADYGRNHGIRSASVQGRYCCGPPWRPGPS
jgi:hypothetical protein